MATRQVQKSEENPSMYMITYFGEHACGTSATAMAACRDPCIISFESSNGGHAKQETSIIPSCQSLSQQREEEALSNVSTIEEPVYFEFGLDQSDSLSGLLSSATSYGMEFMDLEDIISLDHIVLFQP
ncbi:hypothetical protein AXF42_Ash008079 [Apostasia shenzhenica]|uniref:WRKY domain-containing protein n=1 Tax=Apostasia shenzhenica TaxID=1088818 RepID=A0A2I0A8G6_9ASPA|nr:hypothetical protein AXF42_Ash008079 [Apostasia shenzhenica]